MEKTKRDSRHIDPLKDEEKFFQWLKFKSVRMNQEHLSKDDYERLRQRIHVSLRMLRRKRTVRRVAYYGVSVCVIIALGIVAYLNHYERVEPVPSVVEKKAEIVWQPLKSEDIRLVSGDSITSFRQNVQLLLSKMDQQWYIILIAGRSESEWNRTRLMNWWFLMVNDRRLNWKMERKSG